MPPTPCRLPFLLLQSLVWTLWLGFASCEKEPAPSPATTASLPTVPAPALPATAAATSAAPSHPVQCLLADGRMPFQRAQAQYLQLLDARTEAFALTFHDAQGSVSAQVQRLESLLSAPPFALLIQPVDFAAASPLLVKLRLKGTRIFGTDAPSAPSSPLNTNVLCDPRQIGQKAAEVAIQALTRRAADRGEPTVQGRLLEIRGSDTSPWSTEVHAGFVETLRPHPGLVLVHDAPADWTPAEAKARYQEAIRLQKTVDVIFAHDDYLAQAAHQAASESGVREDILIIGVNGFAGPEGGIEMIRRNEIDVSILRPFLVDQAWQLLTLVTTDPEFDLKPEYRFQPRIINPADLDNPGLLTPQPAGP